MAEQQTARTLDQIFDMQTGADIPELGQKLADSLVQYSKDGWKVVSISHAYGPVEGQDTWSAMVLYSRLR